MSMMIHRHKKARAAKKAALISDKVNPMVERVEEPIVSDNEKVYTKSEIARMSTAELQNLAMSVGIENAMETSGAELKKILVEHFGL